MKPRFLTSLLLLFSIFGTDASVFSQTSAKPLRIEDALTSVSFPLQAPIMAWSPDGQRLAYVIRKKTTEEARTPNGSRRFASPGTPSYMLGCKLWVANTKSGKTIKLMLEGSSWGPVWSSDGRYLAFYSDSKGQIQLWVWERRTARIWPVSDVIVRPSRPWEVVRWAPDSRKILTKILPLGLNLEDANRLADQSQERQPNEKKENGSTVLVFRSPGRKQPDFNPLQSASGSSGNHLLDSYLGDLGLVDVLTGEVERIATGVRPSWYSFSPDGESIAFTHLESYDKGNSGQLLFDVRVISLSDMSARLAASQVRLGFPATISWSPDSKLLGYTTGGIGVKGDLFIVPVHGGEPTNLTKALSTSLGHAYSIPLWNEQGDTLYLLASNAIWKVSSSDWRFHKFATILRRVLVEIVQTQAGRFWSSDGGQSMYVHTFDEKTKQAGFYRIDLATGSHQKLLEENKTYGLFPGFNMAGSMDGKRIAYLAEDAQHPPDIWIASMDFRDRRRLTHVNPQFDEYILGASRLIEYRSTDGMKLGGALLLPSNYQEGRSYPVIVWVYGGASGSNNLNRFGLVGPGPGIRNMQLLATRGYAVLYPDAPIQNGTPMRDLAKTIPPAVNKIVEAGIGDPQRLGIMGVSFGGYSALSVLVQTKIFEAAVARAGYYDQVSLYGTLAKNGTAHNTVVLEKHNYMEGTPWEFRNRYIENSSIFFLDRVETPLLLIHGSEDQLFPHQQPEEVFVGLRRLGKKVEYARYEGEGHSENKWSYPNQMDLIERIIAWFDEHLKNRSESQPPVR